MAGREIDLQGGARAWLAGPVQGSGPGLVLCHDGAAGMRELADRLGEEGYVVVAAGAEEGNCPARIESMRGALRARPDCKGRTGVLAFGRCAVAALQAAGQGDFDCAIAYCGPETATVLDAVRNIRVPVVLHWAGERRIESEPSELVEAYAYPGVKAGFAVPDSPHHDKQASAMAYSRTLALLRKVLGPHYDLSSLWEAHRACEFVTRDPDATMRTMVDEPYVNHIPTMTGGVGHDDLKRFYKYHFIPTTPADTKLVPISRTIGEGILVDEMLFCFTHDIEIDWMLPGVKPTGKYVEIPLVAIVKFRGDKLYNEHIYWDQASVLVQIGLLKAEGLPVAGVETANKLVDEKLPSNTLMKRWSESAGKPI